MKSNPHKRKVKIVLRLLSSFIIIWLLAMGIASIKPEMRWWAVPICFIAWLRFLKDNKIDILSEE